MKGPCVACIILAMLCHLMIYIRATPICSAVDSSRCISRSGPDTALSNVSAEHVLWDLAFDSQVGLYTIRVNGSNDCLEGEAEALLNTCSNDSNVWAVEEAALPSGFTISKGVGQACNRLAANASVEVDFVSCETDTLETTWTIQGFALVPSASPTQNPTVRQPTGPKPFEPFSTPFR